MEITSDTVATISTYGLRLKAGPGVSDAEVAKCAKMINEKAQEVSKSIEKEIKAQGLTCNVRFAGSIWYIRVGDAKLSDATADVVGVQMDNDLRINVEEDPRYNAPTIRALTAFFANYRAVAGFVFSCFGVAGAYILIETFKR
jgi:hypothetical protein